jgi:hypothetical protein
MAKFTTSSSTIVLIVITIMMFLVIIIYGSINPARWDWSPKLSMAALVIMITLVVFYYHFDSSRWTE